MLMHTACMHHLTCAQITTALATVQHTLEGTSNTVHSLSGSVRVIDTTLTEVMHGVGALHTTVSGVSGGMADMQAAVGGLQTTVSGVSGGMADMPAAVGGLQAAVGVVGGAIDSMQTTTAQGFEHVQRSFEVCWKAGSVMQWEWAGVIYIFVAAQLFVFFEGFV